MQSTTIMLPSRLKARAKRFARDHGISLGQFVRELLQERLAAPTRRKRDPLFADAFTFKDNYPPDVSENLDKYLAELDEEDYRRQLQQWRRDRRVSTDIKAEKRRK